MIRQIFRQARFVTQAVQNERLSPERALALQNKKLRKMVQHAWENTVFYREKFRAAGLTPADIQTVADLPKLPPTSKQEIQSTALSDVLAKGFSPQNTILEKTSGSSGKALDIYHAPAAWDFYHALVFRHFLGIGYRPWFRLAFTSFEDADPPLWNRLGLGSLEKIDMHKNDPRGYLEDLLHIRPHMITAYSSILLLALHSATPEELARIRPKVVYLHSELLTQGTRQTIKQAFDCDCFDDYSTFEFHQIASECRHHRYHIAIDNVVAEFVQNGQPVQPGEEGEILITGLTNPAMPLLRYAIGDVGVPSDEICPCGRGFPVMKMIKGRVDDYIVMPSGRRLSPHLVIPALEHPGILEHTLVQETLDHIVVYLRVQPEYASTTPNLVLATLQKLFNEPIRLEIKPLQEMERGRTGKLRCVVSKLKSVQYQEIGPDEL